MKLRKHAVILGFVGLLIVIALIAFVRSPVGVALLRPKSHFVPCGENRAVLYEPGAESEAKKIARFLPQAIRVVEEGHFRNFKKPFKVYVCATQESHNKFVGERSLYPIRGTAVLGSVLVAPSAFDFQGRDTHRETLVHELSHLHLAQQLGFLGRGEIPSWLTEGLANCLAGSGGEGISDKVAIASIVSGRHFVVEEKGSFAGSVRKSVAAAGLTPLMFHKQSKMFVGFIRNKKPDAFRRLLLDLQDGEPFAPVFQEHFGVGVKAMWEDFRANISSADLP
ncbi:MAG: hypothetical protein JSW03_08425 [Candidatus Eiseniibacteriota bacterium]|nr:MAG: hypothetical protein JSW03_08425 [Candidatus Eisenbacteria bacterium]